jgi:hypothetical protein
MAWVYDASTHRYRDGDLVVSERQLLDLRNAIADGMTDESATLARQLVDGVLTLVQWAKAFAKLISDGVGAGFLLGRGGVAQLDAASTATLDGLIAEQHDYAKQFATAIAEELDIEEPRMGFVSARSALYSGGAVHAFSVGQDEAMGISLPYYPADGGESNSGEPCVCFGNCRCEWQISIDGTKGTAAWVTAQDGKVCPGCEARGEEYGPDNPFEFEVAE